VGLAKLGLVVRWDWGSVIRPVCSGGGWSGSMKLRAWGSESSSHWTVSPVATWPVVSIGRALVSVGRAGAWSVSVLSWGVSPCVPLFVVVPFRVLAPALVVDRSVLDWVVVLQVGCADRETCRTWGRLDVCSRGGV
jgi:hypothetical protein